MKSCPSCEFLAADDFAFCPKCGGPLDQARPQASADLPHAAAERKTVTTLFCDLVGFTAMSEAADAEDVDVCLREYGTRARELIERYGGTVEKFIGDAVVGVFGVPLAHEDDAERAVRAALRLVRAAAEIAAPDGSPLRARAGVNTGDVLVRGKGAVEPPGQGLVTGDAVNVAARLQAAAPQGGVVAGEFTYELTRRVIRYEPLAPVAAKGKSEPVEAWLALAPVSRTGLAGDDAVPGSAPFVGRDVELAALEQEFDEALRTGSTRSAVIVGGAGMGKSRLVAELSRRVDARPTLVTWRQGRCLPYGEGAAFGAFAEAVKSHAGILDTDDAEARRQKLDAVVPADRDRTWLLERLGALVGVPAPGATLEENVAAWTRFVTALALRRPLVLVLEDVHSADEGFLSFVESLAGTSGAGGTVLLVLTARPELLERRPGFPTPAAAGDGTQPPSVLRVELPPLGEAAVRRIVAAVAADDAGDELAERVVRSAAGNPLHAEEATRLLAAGRPQAALPASVAAVYSARLDALSPAHRDVLTDAAVVGGVFWEGALAAVGGRSLPQTCEALDVLQVAALVRPEGASTIPGEREFAFAHAIAREVAYGRLTRAARAHRHAAVADWLETTAEGREGAFVDELAHHRALACRLAVAAGDARLADAVRRPAVRSVREAGRRAAAIDAAEAEAWYGVAMELVHEDDSLYPTLLAEGGRALLERGRADEARRSLVAAVAAFKRSGQPRAAAVWADLLAGVLVNMDDPGWRAAQDESERLVEDEEPCEEKARVLCGAAYKQFSMDNDLAGAQATVAKLIEVLTALGLDDLEAVDIEGLQADLGWRLGDPVALATLRRRELERPSNNGGIGYCHAVLAFEGPAAAVQAAEHHVAWFDRTSQTFSAESFREMLSAFTLWAGEWDEAKAVAEVAAARLRGTGVIMEYTAARLVRLMREVWCGERPADELAAEVAARAAASTLPDGRFECSVAWAAAALAGGRTEDARSAIRAAARDGGCNPEYCFLLFPEAVRVALRLGEAAAARTLAKGPAMDVPVSAHVRTATAALLAEANGCFDEAAASFADAAASWHVFGVPYEEGQALLGQGRCLVATGRAAGASAPLSAAAATFTRLGAASALREVDDLQRSAGMREDPGPRG